MKASTWFFGLGQSCRSRDLPFELCTKAYGLDNAPRWAIRAFAGGFIANNKFLNYRDAPPELHGRPVSFYHVCKAKEPYAGVPYCGPTSRHIPQGFTTLEKAINARDYLANLGLGVPWVVYDCTTELMVIDSNGVKI
jgi:hypothetical protein